jgi:hypothetical protein
VFSTAYVHHVALAVAIRHHASGPEQASPVRRDKRPRGARSMTISAIHLTPIVSILAGILILIMPRLLNYIVAIYLIVIGIIGLGILR